MTRPAAFGVARRFAAASAGGRPAWASGAGGVRGRAAASLLVDPIQAQAPSIQ